MCGDNNTGVGAWTGGTENRNRRSTGKCCTKRSSRVSTAWRNAVVKSSQQLGSRCWRTTPAAPSGRTVIKAAVSRATTGRTPQRSRFTAAKTMRRDRRQWKRWARNPA